MSNALLLAEPEQATRDFLERHLRQDGFDVVEAENGEALDLLERLCPDLVLIGDPGGPELCRRLREGEPGRSWDREVPVILLGCQESDPVDRVTPPEADRVEAGEIEIDRPTRRVTVGGERIVLPTKEYELLLKLASEPRRVFTKEELLRDVWGFRAMGRTRTLDSHASRLRRRLARPGRATYVQNVWGVGYCLLGD